MAKARPITSVVLFAGLFSASAAMAQFPIIGAEEVKTWMSEKRKVVLIDARTPEEYAAAHIPGAVNIPPENVKRESARLPEDKSTPLIFYCRGAG